MMFPLSRKTLELQTLQQRGQSFHSEEKRSEWLWVVAETTRARREQEDLSKAPCSDSSPQVLTRCTWSGPTWGLRIFGRGAQLPSSMGWFWACVAN